MKPYFLFIILLVLAACQDESGPAEEQVAPRDVPDVTVIHSPNGLGDRGYNDNLYKGIRECKNEYGFRLETHSPLSMDEAEQLMTDWMNDSVSDGKRLLILGSSDFEPMLRAHAGLIPDKARGEVLLLESRATDLPAYTFYLPIYGACYQAGSAAVLLPNSFISAVVCANPLEGPVADGQRGFEAGFKDNGGMLLDTYYLSDDDRGYAMADSLYRLCYALEQNYGFVFPIAGGSSQGLLRFTREYPRTFYTAGMDVDQSGYSSRVTLSVVKHIDRAVYNFLAQWACGQTPPAHQRLGLSSGLVEVVIAPSYEQFFNGYVETTLETAIQKEDAYEDTL